MIEITGKCYKFTAWSCWHGIRSLTHTQSGFLLAENDKEARDIAFMTLDTDDCDYGIDRLSVTPKGIDHENDEFYAPKSSFYNRYHVQLDIYGTV